VRLHEITTPAEEALFLKAGYVLHQGDPHYVRPLDQDIIAVFDAKKNKQLRHKDAAAVRWVLQDGNGKILGRIAAFVNPRYLFSGGVKTGGIGFFECVNDQKAADVMFDAAAGWLRSKGMQAVDGPINFGERNMWWGCLSEGFNDAPSYGMNYNPPYYNDLFTNYGFKTYFNQLVYNYKVDEPVPEKFYEKARRIEANPKYTFDHFHKKDLDKYAQAMADVYNNGWGKHEHFRPTTAEQAKLAFKKMLPVMDEKVIWFGYHDGKPVAFFVMLPDLNQIIRHLNGRLDWWGKLKFAFYQRVAKKVDRIQGVLFGVVTEHQGKGVEGAVIIAAAKVVQPLKRYRNLEITWIGDFNPRMVHMVEGLGAEVSKRYKTYRLMLDPSIEFKTARVID
jgi:hypothetical protein